MKISTKGRYALRFMLDLAANGEGRYVPLKEISARQGISLKYPGARSCPSSGNWACLRASGDLRAAIVWRSCRRTIRWERSCGMPRESWRRWLVWSRRSIPGPRQAECVTLPFWQGLYKAINEYVDSVTLEDLLEQQRERISSEFYI